MGVRCAVERVWLNACAGSFPQSDFTEALWLARKTLHRCSGVMGMPPCFDSAIPVQLAARSVRIGLLGVPSSHKFHSPVWQYRPCVILGVTTGAGFETL